ncbi:protein translocase subunit SecD [Patescibacteria group bacterium]|nr:protein translocase subunit SecD [Patescibacteria group bacterium]
MSIRKLFIFILLLTSLSLVIDFPKEIEINRSIFGKPVNFSLRRPELDLKLGRFRFKRDLEIKKGLDLQGGAHLVLEADMSQIPAEDRSQALDSARAVVSRRVDLYGVGESVIQTAEVGEAYRVIIELPGMDNLEAAIDLVGQTAQLDFREAPPTEDPEATASPMQIFSYVTTGLTGKDLQRASVQFSQAAENSGQPVVALTFTPDGAEKFSQVTARNVGKQVAIFLDEMPLTAPTVNEAITSGDAVISGSFTTDEAKKLTIQLNAGALPVPMKLIEQKNIGATLGADSVKKSLRAGLVGLSLVMLFMWGLYGRLGFIADVALIIYGLVTLAIYKLIPVTLTLPGLAGFILSVGMAVDANILIFERFKEEIRVGRSYKVALELAFGRAWDSIKDANACTLITCFILFNPLDWSWLNTSGMIRGFALTLFLGVAISLFTGIVVTRTLLRLFIPRGKKS